MCPPACLFPATTTALSTLPSPVLLICSVVSQHVFPPFSKLLLWVTHTLFLENENFGGNKKKQSFSWYCSSLNIVPFLKKFYFFEYIARTRIFKFLPPVGPCKSTPPEFPQTFLSVWAGENGEGKRKKKK